MIAVKLLTREEVAEQLAALGCEPVPQEQIPEHSVWRTAYGMAFLIPEVGPDHMTSELSLARAMEQIREYAPRPN